MDHIYGPHEMPFQNKYPHMGHTEKLRLPARLIPHALQIAEECERICGAHDVAYVDHILEKVIAGLEIVP